TKTPERPTTTRLDYGMAIENLRRERQMTREALAEASGVSASYLSEVVRGFKRPSADVLAKIATALGMAPSELLAYVESLSAGPPVARFASPGPAHLDEAPGPAEPPPPMASLMAPPATRSAWLAARRSYDTVAVEKEEAPQGNTVNTLVHLARRLDAEDLRVLVDLARRFVAKLK
ncbi:MAG: helix-turn-helix transcriptional regulator, partial [Armatimonadetes bacterium]|nr:helix-turn-helix transcriptional regulator [Armatimonadota bacterium]